MSTGNFKKCFKDLCKMAPKCVSRSVDWPRGKTFLKKSLSPTPSQKNFKAKHKNACIFIFRKEIGEAGWSARPLTRQIVLAQSHIFASILHRSLIK
ncbi:MAG: hypothetical protein A2Y14_05275 [Verrucomicrobia bacterium GWF2_51_19]|nr:MAG: hypothetical protein A2Y14_05275 [Verrucomicrobia bacterium GWF2_51_19]HCJ12338.1 hypothetical protein [Opitutae bacterium]